MSFERVEIGPHVLYRGDCLEVMDMLGRVDAVVTDPPYGISVAKSGTIGSSAKNQRGKMIASIDYGLRDWDGATADEAVFASVAAARWAVVFGGNFYALPPSSCWLVWDKMSTGDFADCELAWTNLPGAVRRMRYLWNGMMRANHEPRGDHPTQKPLGVMRWIMGLLPNGVETVADTFMGSGTTGVAAVRCGFRFVGVERERDYFLTACRRVEMAMREPDLFSAGPEKPAEQLDLLGETS